jgi:uncharacterized protein YndB with AHSA1/START domain
MAMMQQPRSGATDPNNVRKAVRTEAPQVVAWQVFTEQMRRWWPLDNYKIGKAKAIDAIIEPRVGGRWYERGDEGSTCDWGSVLAWEPPARLVLSWDITADWQYDRNLKTEIELRFIPNGKGATRVELQHRRLDRYGARRDEMHRIFESEGGGWSQLLAMFARVAAEVAAASKDQPPANAGLR